MLFPKDCRWMTISPVPLKDSDDFTLAVEEVKGRKSTCQEKKQRGAVVLKGKKY
jgi:hypothetical protein